MSTGGVDVAEDGTLTAIEGEAFNAKVGQQTGADQRRVEEMLKRLERVYVELAPGDGLFFHCNLMHRSDANQSDEARWTLICCYNTKHNDPFEWQEGRHPKYSPLDVLRDDQLKAVGMQQWQTLQAQAKSSTV